MTPAPTVQSPTPDDAALVDRIAAVKARLQAAMTAAGRAPESVELLAVSKFQPADAVRAAHRCGLRSFGENYVQEALEKMQALTDIRPHLRWTLIGPLQANKTRVAAEQFDAVLTVDRLKIAQRLSDQRPGWLAPLDVALQVNISDEASKSGMAPAQVAELARAVAALPRLRLRGLMAIPAPADGDAARRPALAALRTLFETLRRDGLDLDLLSVGMSDDLEAAVAEGSTQVRIGTAIFGPRPAAMPHAPHGDDPPR